MNKKMKQIFYLLVKKTSLRVILITTFMLSILNTFGYGSAKVSKVWLEHGVTKNGERGMIIHADITASGIKGNRIEAIAYFYDEQKNKLMGGISGYKTNDGQVCAWDYGKSSYDDCRWQDFDIFIPLRALPLASGKHTYYIIVDVKDVTQNKMMTNNWDYISFTGTGNNNHVPNYSKKQDNLESRLKIGDDDDDDDDDDTIECGVCRGTGISTCLGCSGTGVTMSSHMDVNGYFWPTQVSCKYCNGTGGVKCSWCNGKGYSRKIATQQRNINNNGFYGGGAVSNGSSGSGSNSSRRTCPGCNGTGKGADQITYAPDYTGNSTSVYCSVCGRTTSRHSHHQSTCRVCYGKGYVE